MGALGAQASYGVVGFLQDIYEQNHWYSFVFQEMIFTPQRLRTIKKVCIYRLALLFAWLLRS